MTPPDDSQRDEPAKGPHGPGDPDLPADPPFDEDAAWRAIVDNYGERASLEETAPAAPEPPAPPAAPEEPVARPEQRQDVEEHFVPPDPPPVPRGTPARRLAWAGLFGPPLLMILAVAFRWTFPAVVTMGLVAAFVGGFVFLVCTMPRDGGDGWGDGAVV